MKLYKFAALFFPLISLLAFGTKSALPQYISCSSADASTGGSGNCTGVSYSLNATISPNANGSSILGLPTPWTAQGDCNNYFYLDCEGNADQTGTLINTAGPWGNFSSHDNGDASNTMSWSIPDELWQLLPCGDECLNEQEPFIQYVPRSTGDYTGYCNF
jgi:hypothetical protein